MSKERRPGERSAGVAARAVACVAWRRHPGERRRLGAPSAVIVEPSPRLPCGSQMVSDNNCSKGFGLHGPDRKHLTGPRGFRIWPPNGPKGLKKAQKNENTVQMALPLAGLGWDRPRPPIVARVMVWGEGGRAKLTGDTARGAEVEMHTFFLLIKWPPACPLAMSQAATPRPQNEGDYLQ